MLKIWNLCNFWDDEGLKFLFRLKGSVLLHIYRPVLFFILYSTAIVCLHAYVETFKLKFSLHLVFVMGVVTGFLLVFRTTTAYDRYWEGRCLFSKMNHHIRSVTRVIWAGVDTEEPKEDIDKVKSIIERLSAINLLVAFAYATKNFLREEYSYQEHDLKDLIGHLPRFRKKPSKNQNILAKSTHEGSIPKKIEARKMSTALGLDELPKDCGTDEQKTSMFGLKAHDYHVPTNIPIELSYHLFCYLKNVKKRAAATGTNIGLSYWSVSVLIDCLTNLERILRTPIPLAYSIHLHQCVYVYLLAIPFQLVGVLNWLTIPAVAICSFAFLGILRIGREIENPFGYDDNDLPLDDFCEVMRKEIQVIVGNTMPSLDSWILSKENFPLAPHSFLSADELKNKSLKELRDILAKGAELREEIVTTTGKSSLNGGTNNLGYTDSDCL